jgi:heterodisulfide reductase subunit A
MKIAVYLCSCGTIIGERIDLDLLKAAIEKLPDVVYVKSGRFLCSDDGKSFVKTDLEENRPDRVVVAACSPRDHEATFSNILSNAGINPYLLQFVNIREQIAWVTSDKEKALQKAISWVRSAIARVRLHEPLEKEEITASPEVLVIGAGPAGLKAALSLAEAGRKVTLLEKAPLIGGMPVRFEELFPNMECGPCMMEPLMGEIFHGPWHGNIELLTCTDLVEVAGYYGNFIVRMRQRPRHVDLKQCIGCAECVFACPEETDNPINCGMGKRKAIDFPFIGALPNAPTVDMPTCRRSRGEDCTLCQEACPISPDLIRFDEEEQILERNVGAIVVAIGATLYDAGRLPALGYGVLPEVYTSLEFERLLAATGPTRGQLQKKDGTPPGRIAIIHCAGSLDEGHCAYCSAVCCQYALKYSHLITSRLPGTRVFHLFRELVIPGKERYPLYQHCAKDQRVEMLRYGKMDDLQLSACTDGGITINISSQTSQGLGADMVVLCPAVVPAPDAMELGRILDLPEDRFGFFEELHGRLDAAQSKIKGIYLAGSCQGPMDVQLAALQGMAAAGHILSGLAAGKKLEIEPITAAINEELCAGCRICATVCPYKAIGFNEEQRKSEVNPLLCHGCGTCVAACPAGALTGRHFTNEEILAELEELLA